MQSVTGRVVDPASSFSASSNHLVFGIAFSTIMLIFLLSCGLLSIKINKKIFSRLAPILLLFLYQYISVIWSPQPLVSFGNATYSLYYLLIGVIVGLQYPSQPLGAAVNKFCHFFIKLLILDFIISLIFNIINDARILAPAMGEKVVISAILIMLIGIYATKKRLFSKSALIYFIIFGRSFSALVAIIAIIPAALQKRRNVFIKAIYIVTPILFFISLYFLITTATVTFFGKTTAFFMTGSGRFAVWQALIEHFLEKPLSAQFFGDGFMSERVFLSSLGTLSWVIDAHSNILQALHGLGCFGLALLIAVWIRIDRLCVRYRRKNQDHKIFLSILRYSNISFILFGLTASTYFSRYSLSMIFILGLLSLTISKLESRQ